MSKKIFKQYNSSSKKKHGAFKKEEKIYKIGVVLEALPNTHFKVKLDEGKEIIAYLSGKLRLYRIKILLGDKVKVEMTHYDENRGRIVYRGAAVR